MTNRKGPQSWPTTGMSHVAKEIGLANENHLRVLRKGVKHWNSWRSSTPVKPDLSKTTFYDELGRTKGASLRTEGVELSDVNFQGTNLAEANFYDGYRRRANLTNANLQETDLTGSNLWEANLTGADLVLQRQLA